MSSKVWYLFKDNHHIGPFSAQEIKDRFDRGEFSTNIPVWRDGEQEWIPLSNQSELASFVIPTEAVELPPLPPLPNEAYDNAMPELETPADELSQDLSQELDQDQDLEDKLSTLEQELPKENVSAQDFWQVDSPAAGEGQNEPEVQDIPEQPIASMPTGAGQTPTAPDLQSSLQEKLVAVRSRLGEKVEVEPSPSSGPVSSTYADGEERFIKPEASGEESFVNDDPIRSNQQFDGDDGLPDFMAEESVDYLSKYAESAEPSQGDLAAIQASGQFTEELSEEVSEGVQEEVPGGIPEGLPESLQDEASPFIDPTKVDEETLSQVEDLKSEASSVQDVEEDSELHEATFLPEEYADDYPLDRDESEHEYADEEGGEFDEFEAPTESASKFWIKLVATILVVSILGITSSQLFFQKKKIPSLTKLSKTDARAFREVIDNGSRRFHYQFAVSDDEAMNIWFATNLPDQGLLEVQFESKDKKVVSKQKIIASGKTEILSYVGRFKEVRLIEGDQLAEGEYHVTGTFKVGGSKTQLMQWLKEKTPLGNMQFFKYQRSEYKIDGTFYFSRKRGSELKENIAKFWDDIKVAKTKPLLIELQKWRTLKTLSEKVVMLFSQSLELGLKSIKATSNDFQKNYAEVVAPVFQTLTLDTQSLIQDDKKLLPAQVSRLENLLDLQKAFGLDVAANLDSLGKYKKLTKSIKKDLVDAATQRQQKFAAKVDIKIKELQEQLAKASL